MNKRFSHFFFKTISFIFPIENREFLFLENKGGGILFKYFLERGKVCYRSRIKLNERENENYRNHREKIRKHFNVGKHLRLFALKYYG